MGLKNRGTPSGNLDTIQTLLCGKATDRTAGEWIAIFLPYLSVAVLHIRNHDIVWSWINIAVGARRRRRHPVWLPVQNIRLASCSRVSNTDQVIVHPDKTVLITREGDRICSTLPVSLCRIQTMLYAGADWSYYRRRKQWNSPALNDPSEYGWPPLNHVPCLNHALEREGTQTLVRECKVWMTYRPHRHRLDPRGIVFRSRWYAAGRLLIWHGVNDHSEHSPSRR